MAYTCSAVQQIAMSNFMIPAIMVQYNVYITKAANSSRKAVLVRPVPDTAWKNTIAPTVNIYELHITSMDGMVAGISSGISV